MTTVGADRTSTIAVSQPIRGASLYGNVRLRCSSSRMARPRRQPAYALRAGRYPAGGARISAGGCSSDGAGVSCNLKGALEAVVRTVTQSGTGFPRRSLTYPTAFGHTATPLWGRPSPTLPLTACYLSCRLLAAAAVRRRPSQASRAARLYATVVRALRAKATREFRVRVTCRRCNRPARGASFCWCFSLCVRYRGAFISLPGRG